MKRILIVLIIIMLLMNFSVAVDEIGVKERELKEIADELKKVDSKIKLNKSDQYNIIDKINVVENEIKKLDGEIVGLNDNINLTEISIKNTQIELTEKNSELEEMKSILSKRIRVMYKTGDVGYAEVLLGSKSFIDLLNRIEIVKKIVKHDKNLITLVKEKIEKIESLKVGLEENKVELSNYKLEVEVNKSYLVTNESKLEVQKSELKNNIKLLEAMEDKLEEDANKVTDIIKNLKMKAEYVGGQMGWPVPSSYRITSPFGYRIHPVYHTKKLHTGIDIAAKTRTNIVAAQTGNIIYNDWLGGYGKVVMIDHGGGYVTLYAHLSSSVVKIGQEVTRGDLIAKSGTTGVSTGPHLHFEVRINGDYVNPLNYLKN
jgi:murein DD-endopeptidase MepM/ murein hydrolase activator NlpD